MSAQWTFDDERRLRDITEEMNTLAGRRRAALEKLKELALQVCDPYGVVQTELMVAYADDLRDALAPFDSGIREGLSQ